MPLCAATLKPIDASATCCLNNFPKSGPSWIAIAAITSSVPLSEVAEKFGVSRTHVRKLFAAAAARDWLGFEPGGQLTIGEASFSRFRLWFGLEFTWARRLVGSV